MTTISRPPPCAACAFAKQATSSRQRGAAILTAMVIVTLVASLSSAMMWKQWRAVEIETSERARVQSGWILGGALDWARLILREDARGGGGADHLGEPWAVPLAEARLSTFLALDRGNTLTQDGPDAFLSGTITDAQSRFNLTNLLERGADAENDIQVLERLCEQIGLPAATARQIALGLRKAHGMVEQDSTNNNQAGDAPLAPRTMSQLVWLGLSPAVVAELTPYVTLLPVRTPVNVNTAPRELLAAVLPGLDLASAERLLRAREQAHFQNLGALGAALGQPEFTADPRSVSVASGYFEVRGRLRLEERVVEEWSLLERRGLLLNVVHRERRSMLTGS